MTLLRTPFAAVRTRRLRDAISHLDDRLRRDVGLPEKPAPVGLELIPILFKRLNE